LVPQVLAPLQKLGPLDFDLVKADVALMWTLFFKKTIATYDFYNPPGFKIIIINLKSKF